LYAKLSGRTDRRILVPGCGTGRHPLWIAAGNPDSEIVAVDLSKESLAYGKRMAMKLNIANVLFKHGDLLELPESGETFHHIDCAGVLHHLENPKTGWAALDKMTIPGGTLRIALYSSVARLPVTYIRNEIKRLEIKPETIAMKTFRRNIMTGEQYAGIRKNLSASIDFFTMSSIRDLLFHTREHQYTLAQLKEIIHGFRFNFLGFRLNSSTMKAKYLEQFPDDPDMASFDNWQRFEKSYAGTLNMFDFWLQKPFTSA
jgi:ubiquinone/menaquinone biosynthesis C-methylase UbiE